MPAISSKGLAMPQSPIRKLVPYAEAATEQGKKIYYLNIGQPDIKTPEVALEAVKNNDRLKKLKWHIWHVDSIKAFEDLIRRDNTGIILLKNNKHLDNLN